MNIRSLAVPVAFALSIPAFLGMAGSAAGQDKLNVVFILADDLGCRDVRFAHPETFYETPHLDSLAKSGMVFTDFYAASPVCSPTRASILTGKHPARLGATNYFTGQRAGKFDPADFETELALSEVTLAEAFKEAGYRTGHIGKWHLGGTGALPTDQGFDLNRGGGENGLPHSHFAPYKNVTNLPSGPEGEYLTTRLAEESVTFIEESAKTNQPFFLNLSFYAVHTPLQAPQELVEKYEKKAATLGLNTEEGRFDPGRERQVWPDTKEPRKVRIRQDHAVYAAMVESLDTAVGRVLAKLDDLNLRESTAIVFTSDNGGVSTSEGEPTSNLPYRAGKGWIYEGGVRVPLVVRWPGVAAPGTVCSAPALSTDFYPTLLEMAGLPAKPDQHVDGVSIVPLLRNPFAKFDRGPIYFHYPHYSNQGGFPASAVRKGNHILIQDLEDGAYELYDLPTDPQQHNNLEQLESGLVEEFSGLLNEWRKEVGAKPLKKSTTTGAEPPALW
jgi:arylsulfatase A-like enzyme